MTVLRAIFPCQQQHALPIWEQLYCLSFPPVASARLMPPTALCGRTKASKAAHRSACMSVATLLCVKTRLNVVGERNKLALAQQASQAICFMNVLRRRQFWHDYSCKKRVRHSGYELAEDVIMNSEHRYGTNEAQCKQEAANAAEYLTS